METLSQQAMEGMYDGIFRFQIWSKQIHLIMLLYV